MNEPISFSDAVQNFKDAFFKEIIEPIGKPINDFLVKLLTKEIKMNKQDNVTKYAFALELIATQLHEENIFKGFWLNDDLWLLNSKEPHLRKAKVTLISSKLALVHSEISEALEGIRKDTMDDHLPHKKTFDVELVDALIRILDLAAACEVDIAGALIEKCEYNRHRADHKLENRNAVGGKVI